MSALAPAPALEDLALQERVRDRLIGQLRVQRAAAIELYRWYECQQDPPALPPGERGTSQFDRLRRMARGAWARLIVDAIAERLRVQGVRTTVGIEADDEAWALLQANSIDSDQRDVHVEALITGRSYVSVVANEADGARIVPETCLEVTHSPTPGDKRTVAAALKVFELDLDFGVWACELYLPTRTLVWSTTVTGDRDPVADSTRVKWSEEPLVVANALGVVPLVPFENRPTAALAAESELTSLVPVMERIQELELGKLMASHTAVFRQKWMTGDAIPTDPDTGKKIEPFKAGVDRLWVSEKADARFGSFEATEVRQYTSAIDAEVAELAAISRVPSYYLVQSELANPPSAESLIASDAGLVAKCLDRMATYGESWERVTRLALRHAGQDEAANDSALEVIWRTPERRNPAVVAAAAVQLQTIGVPTEELWAFVGYSPQAIERMRAESAQQQLIAELTAPPPQTPSGAAG